MGDRRESGLRQVVKWSQARTVSATLLELSHVVLLPLSKRTLGFTILGTVRNERGSKGG